LKYSLLICTRNRAEKLAVCLQSVGNALKPEIDVELILVDNGSTDATGEVISQFEATHPALRTRAVRENRAGLSRARNAGLEAARGELLVFTDDDCRLDVDYFVHLDRARRQFEFDYFSGNILLGKSSYGELGGYLYKDEVCIIVPRTIHAPGHLQGSNMGFTREVIDRIGKFNYLIGDGTAFRFEDIEYATRASLAGFRGIHLPEVFVIHDHGRERDSPELAKLFRANSIAAGAYCVEALLFAGVGGLRYWSKHWRRLYRGHDGGRPRLKWELQGAASFLVYLIRKRYLPRIRIE
jgi:glycosyltransferase involved in cell wall biosynthesis